MTEEQKKYLIDLNGMLFFKSEQDKENLEKFIKKDDALNSLGAISYLVKQNLTEEQRAQARENIGAAAPGEGGGGNGEDEIIVITNETLNEEDTTITISQETADIIANYDGSKPMFLLVKEVGILIPHTLGGVFSVIQGNYQMSIDFSEGRLSTLVNNENLISTDATGKIPLSYIPKLTINQLPDLGFYDDVIEGYLNPNDELFYKRYWDTTNIGGNIGYDELITGESGKIYLDLHTNNTYRWGGSVYVRINPDEYTIATNEQILALFN